MLEFGNSCYIEQLLAACGVSIPYFLQGMARQRSSLGRGKCVLHASRRFSPAAGRDGRGGASRDEECSFVAGSCDAEAGQKFVPVRLESV